MDIIWILTEEKPKNKVVAIILKELLKEKYIKDKFENLKIKPVIENCKFQFKYSIVGISCCIIIKLIQAKQGSFVDYLVFKKAVEPNNDDRPIYVIEETKTTPAESRNVSVYQRLSKFVFVDSFPIMEKSKKIMLYNIRQKYDTIPNTFVFGVRSMKTLDINILGLENIEQYAKFDSLNDLMNSKNKISTKRKDNVPIQLFKQNNTTVSITAKLEKSKKLGHDPNIGAVTALAKLVKITSPDITKIIVKNHGLTQDMVRNKSSKFIKLATPLGIELDGLTIDCISIKEEYWEYSKCNEKIVSILVHNILDYNNCKVIYDNHAGSEQGYFEFPDGTLESIKKKTSKPDLIFMDKTEQILYVIEAEKSSNVFKKRSGVDQLSDFDDVENIYCSKYEGHSYERRVICHGNELSQKELDDNSILLQLKTDGTFMFSKDCPDWFKQCFQS
ncbi:MAG: hypothetical protein R1F52_04510 [Candidatus Nitrosoabyssus spongiisocia]|nr:MAG: hypothetical protein R1F52_04510 [Nitrosopumilaceae archaeon AB1(1)]